MKEEIKKIKKETIIDVFKILFYVVIIIWIVWGMSMAFKCPSCNDMDILLKMLWLR